MDPIYWLGTWGGQLAAQTTACLALGGWISIRLERSPARSHLVVLLAFAAALITPAVSGLFLFAGWSLFDGPAAPTVYRRAGTPRPAASPSLLGTALLTGWAVGSACLLGGLAVSYARGRRLAGRSEPVTDPALRRALQAAGRALGLDALPELRSSPEVPAPMLWGWGRPAILVPDEAAGATGLDWEAIFLHELAHLRRADHLTGLLADVAAALLFWNPVAWWARGQLARTSEFACDDWVTRAGRQAVDFARALLALRREAVTDQLAAPALLGRRATLKERVVRLLHASAPPARFGPAYAAAAAVIAFAVVIGLSATQASPKSRAADREPAAALLAD